MPSDSVLHQDVSPAHNQLFSEEHGALESHNNIYSIGNNSPNELVAY